MHGVGCAFLSARVKRVEAPDSRLVAMIVLTWFRSR